MVYTYWLLSPAGPCMRSSVSGAAAWWPRSLNITPSLSIRFWQGFYCTVSISYLFNRKSPRIILRRLLCLNVLYCADRSVLTSQLNLYCADCSVLLSWIYIVLTAQCCSAAMILSSMLHCQSFRSLSLPEGRSCCNPHPRSHRNLNPDIRHIPDKWSVT